MFLNFDYEFAILDVHCDCVLLLNFIRLVSICNFLIKLIDIIYSVCRNVVMMFKYFKMCYTVHTISNFLMKFLDLSSLYHDIMDNFF